MLLHKSRSSSAQRGRHRLALADLGLWGVELEGTRIDHQKVSTGRAIEGLHHFPSLSAQQWPTPAGLRADFGLVGVDLEGSAGTYSSPG